MTPRQLARVRFNIALAAAMLACASRFAPATFAAEPRYSFAVVSGAMRSAADEPRAQRLLGAIGLDQRVSFLAYDGNLKGAGEPCADRLYERRQQLLETSTVPVVAIAGQHDWADCAMASNGSYDAAERLDFLRQTLFSDTVSLGRPTLALARESEVARFHAFRENVRWEADGTVFVGLDVVGGNNHYSDAGGRNGEFDDRAIASAFWLEHAAEYAKRRRARALVVFVEADPNFTRYEEHADRFAWLRFERHRRPDGYLEFKRSLVKAAQTFRGPVIVIHHDVHALAGGFAIDQPLFNDRGERVANLTRIAIAPRDPSTQWVRFDVDFGKTVPFRVSVSTVPKTLPAPPAMPTAPFQAPASVPGASGPVTMPLPGIENVPPAQPQPPAVLPQPVPGMPPVGAPASEPPLLLLPDHSNTGPSRAAPETPASPASPPPQQPLPGGAPAPAIPNSMQGGGS